MRFKKVRLFIAVGAVVATMSFTGAAMASPSNHNTMYAQMSQTTYTHNHANHQSSWQYMAPAQTQAAHNHASHMNGQQQNTSGQAQNHNGQNHASQSHE